MNRLQRFDSLKTHPFYKNLYKRLSTKDVEIAVSFLKGADLLSKDEFAHLAVRLFVDVKDKPKNWAVIEELLMCSN